MSNIDELLKVDQDIIDRLFPARKDYKDVEGDTFELALVLGGTVSAGAYTAGVLDFLIEALDCWESEKAKDSNPPNWKTIIKAVSGTSGGGVLAATFAKAVTWDFPHVSSPVNNPKPVPLNPFYHVWVDSLDIKYFLATDDLKGNGEIKSLLNSRCRTDAGNYVAHFPPSFLVEKRRSYVVDPLPVFLTLTNLKGIPYKVEWSGNLSQSYLSHIDYVRLAIFAHGGNGQVREDEFGVSFKPINGYISWDDVAKFALGTSAFPVGLPLEPLSRPIKHYCYRPIVIPGDNGTSNTEVKPSVIDWQSLVGKGQTDVDMTYHFLAADGGVINNEPIELCRRELAGILGRNPRDGKIAKRALILVDPFFDSPQLGPESSYNVLSGLGAVFNGLKNEARYDSQDLILAGDPDCYSRFMITANRGKSIGAKAIATASLGAFGGFLCQKYREHDFFLGRKNCQEFLANVENLWFPESNPTFADWSSRNPDLAKALKQKNSKGDFCLPLIPLYGTCVNKQSVPNYPTGEFKPKANWFQEALSDRVDVLLGKANDELTNDFISETFVNIGLNFGGKSKLIDFINDKITKGLKEWDLL